MTVQAVDPSSRWTASPGATNFVYAFKIRRGSDLLVQVDGVAKVLGLDYSVSGVTAPTGDIAFFVPMAGGEQVILTRNMPYDRTTDYQNLGDLRAATLNNDQDDPVMMIQQLVYQQKFVPLLPATLDPNTFSNLLPIPTLNNIIGWNDTLTGFKNVDPSVLATTIAYGNKIVALFQGIAQGVDGVNVNFPLGQNPGSIGNLDVSIDGVTQINGVDFTYVGTTLVFAAPPPSGATVQARFDQAVPVGTGTGTAISFQQSGAGSVVRDIQAKAREILSAEDKGVAGNMGVDVTAQLQSLITQGGAESREIVLGAGVFLVSALTGASNVAIRGQGRGKTIIRRNAAAVGNASPLTFSGKTGFSIRDLTIDGNKAAQSNGASNCTLSTCWDYEVRNCAFINAKAASGFGEGLLVIDDANRTNDTDSAITGNRFKSNDSTGCLISRAWHINVTGNMAINNTGDGIAVADYSFPIVDNNNSHIIVSGNQCHGNQGNGILVRGYAVGGSVSVPIYGPSANSTYIDVTDNICNGNRVYGIAYQGAYGNVTGNLCANNSGTGFSAGILFNCLNSNCTGNTVANNEIYGIDSGGSSGGRIADNNCYTDGDVGINLGASYRCSCDNNTIIMGGSDVDIAITYDHVDGDGVTPFPQVGRGTSITRNKITLNSNGASVGISVQGDVLDCIVHDNEVMGASTPFQAYQLAVDLIDVQGNVDDYTSNFVGSRWGSVASAGILVVPDWCEKTFVSGTTNIASVRTYSSALYDGKVRAIRMTSQGSGYSQGTPPTVALVGGGGAGATATALVDNGGRLVGFTITNPGAGYTSAPAANITHNGGVGAVGTAIINCNNADAREITMFFNGALTVFDGSNIDLVGNYVTTAGKSKLTLIGVFGSWSEVSRATT